MSKARERHNAEMNHQGRLGLLLLGILLAVLFVVNPFSSDDPTSTEVQPQEDPNLSAMADLEVDDGPSEVEREAQEAMARKLRIAQEKREQEQQALEEPQRRVVRPPRPWPREAPWKPPQGVPPQHLHCRPSVVPRRPTGRATTRPPSTPTKRSWRTRGGNPSPTVHLGFGKALYHTGQFDRAMRHLIRAEKAGVADRDAYRFLIELHRQQGDDAGVNTYTQKLSQLR